MRSAESTTLGWSWAAVVMALSGILAVPTPAAAQQERGEEPRAIEVGGGGLIYFPRELGNSNLPALGAQVSLAANVSSHIGIAGELVAYRVRAHNTPYSFAAGPRIFTRRSINLPRGRSAVGVFGQVLVGAFVGGPQPQGLGVQPGAGLTLGRSAIFVYEFDYAFVSGAARNRSGWRNMLGVVVGLGGQVR